MVFTLTGAIRIYYLKNTFYLSRFISSQLSSLAFLKIINQDYEYHIEKKTNEEERLIDSSNELINDKKRFKTTLILEVLSKWVKSFKRSFKAKNINLKN